MIDTINLTSFAPLVQVYAPGAPWPMVSAMLRRSAIEFCERTRCWRQSVPVDVTRQDEAIVLPNYAAVHKIEGATFNGDIRLEPIPFDEADQWPPIGQPRFITQRNENTVHLVPFEAGSLELDLFLKPVEGVAYAPVPGPGYPQDQYDVVPKFLYTGHAETIAAGALARILILPKQPFTSPDLAGVFLNKFERETNRHFADVVSGQQQAPIRTKPSFM